MGETVSIIEKIIDENEYFNRIKRYRNIILFGAGSKARQTVDLLEQRGVTPTAVCDNNSKLWGSLFLNQYPIYSYAQIKEKYEDYCFVLTVASGNAVEIERELMNKDNHTEIFHACNSFKVDSKFLLIEEIKQEEEKYTQIYESFADRYSKELYIEFLNSKLTGNQLKLCHMTVGDSFFDKEIISHKEKMVYVDVGAYTGDTVCKFLEYSGGQYQKIIAFEADKGNYDALCKFVRYARVDNIDLINKGVWSEKKIMQFYTNDDNAELNYDSPNLYNSIERAADATTLKKLKEDEIHPIVQNVEVNSLDFFLQGETPSIIKINALAADYPILCGAEQTLRRTHTTVIMEYGVRPSYLLEEMLFLIGLNIGYKLYLRQKNIFGDSKTILYAV